MRQLLCCGFDSWTRTNGLTSLRSFSQVRNRRTAALERRLYLLLTTLPPRFIPHCGRFGSAPNRCVHISHGRWFEQPAIYAKTGPPEGDPVLRGDSWTRTNDPIDVNDVLYRLSHATICGNRWHYIMRRGFGQGEFPGAMSIVRRVTTGMGAAVIPAEEQQFDQALFIGNEASVVDHLQDLLF